MVATHLLGAILPTTDAVENPELLIEESVKWAKRVGAGLAFDDCHRDDL